MKIAIVTGSRADWNGLGMVGQELIKLGAQVEIIAVGQQANDAPHSLEVIRADGFKPLTLRTGHGDTAAEIAKQAGRACEVIAAALKFNRPDLILLLGDRFEILGAAMAAALMKIPLAHIGGGDVTQGSIDNRLRYAISALADIHFVTNAQSFNKLRGVLRPTDYICLSGAPALDRVIATAIVPRATFFADIGLSPNERNILVLYHAATLDADPIAGCREMIAALELIKDASFLVIGTNEDEGSSQITRLLERFTEHRPAIFMHNMEPRRFYSALAHCDCLVGNSSAGLVEAPLFGIPVVNIGNRQAGRQGAFNVRCCAPTREAIKHTIDISLGEGRKVCASAYGDGHSAPKIAKALVGWLER